MAWSDVLTVYDAHLVTAGATLSPKITTVTRGGPTSLSTVPVIGYWWGGRRESTTGGNTFGKVNVEEGLTTTIYVPESVKLPNRAATVEDYLRAAVNAIHAELFGDAGMGGYAIGISNDTLSTTPNSVVVGKILALTAEFTCWIDLSEVHSIAL